MKQIGNGLAGKERKDEPSKAIERSLNASANEGLLNSVMMGTAENYIGAFGVFLQGSTFQIGMLSTLPPLIGAFVQPFAVQLMQAVKSRRRIMVLLAWLQAFIWLPIGFIPFVLGRGTAGMLSLLGLIAGYQMLAGLGAPVWNSLIGDIVPEQRRASFLAWRSRRCAVAGFVSLLCAGQILSLFQNRNASAIGFSVIFSFALIARLLSVYWMGRYADPPAPKLATPTSRLFGSDGVRRTPFGRFVLFQASMSFAVQLAAPFFALYILKDLHYSYARYTFLNAIAMVSQVVFMSFWARLISKKGSAFVILLCAAGIALNSLLWVVTTNFWLILGIELYTGMMWSGFGLAISNFLFETVAPERRASAVAYQSIVNACFVWAGAAAGAWLLGCEEVVTFLRTFSALPGSVYPVAFLVSGLGRLLVVSVFAWVLLKSRLKRPLAMATQPTSKRLSGTELALRDAA